MAEQSSGVLPLRVVNVHHGVPYDVYVGRAGRGQSGYFGSPIRIGKMCPECGLVHEGRGQTIPCYEAYIDRRLRRDLQFRSAVTALAGKVLGCFCVDRNGNGQCHAHILAARADELKSKEEQKL